MVKQLLLCKRLMIEGASFAERSDSVSSGMAISLFQDSLEMYVWTLIKDRNITVKESASFTSNLETLQKRGISLSYTAKLLELNKARVGFKHYGNLPASDEAKKFQIYVEEFLRASFKDHFSMNFDEVSLVDLVTFVDVRERLKEAEKLINEDELQAAATETARAKDKLFSRLDRLVPRVDRKFERMDSVFNSIPELRNKSIRCFLPLAQYLYALRESVIYSFLKLPIVELKFIRSIILPSVITFDSERSQVIHHVEKYEKEHCMRAISCLVNISIRVETII